MTKGIKSRQIKQNTFPCLVHHFPVYRQYLGISIIMSYSIRPKYLNILRREILIPYTFNISKVFYSQIFGFNRLKISQQQLFIFL